MSRVHLTVGVVVCAAAVLAGIGVAGAAATGSAGGTRSGLAWVDRGMHVVGGPVVAGGRVLVLVAAADRSVWLEAVDPKTGAVSWRVPEGFSEITAGVAATPLAHGGVALALAPVAGQNGALVRFEGVDVSTGAVLWRWHSPLFVADAPTMCPSPLGSRAFCVIVATAPRGLTTLIALSPRTGTLLGTVPNIERLMSMTPGLYQTYARPSILAGVRIPDGVSWSKPVSSLFGAGYDPDYGWDFDQYGTVEVGTVGKVPVGKSVDLGASKTVAFVQATGNPIWTVPGAYRCGGQDGVRGPFLCLMTGTASATAAGALTTSTDATLTLQGFAPATGRITWQLEVGGRFTDLLLGNVAIEDADHLLVTSQEGQELVLDLRTGATSAPAAGEVFWCARFNLFKIRPPKGLSPQRVGSSLFAPCNQTRHPVASFAPPPSVAGATVGQTFVWAAPDGLKAARQP